MDANLGLEFLNSFSNVPAETINQLMSISKLKEVKPGKQIVKLNEVPTKIYMLASGVARCYLTTENGKEFNKNFFLPYSFIAPLTALVKNKPSLFVFETLTGCQIYEVDYYKISDLCKKNMSVNTLYSKVLESVYMTYEKRLVELISLDAKERYLELRKQIPNVDELIPQYHIASYLGITSVQLSRIRKKIDDD
ncbi:cAMP-binding domain of CRP or a regulatory subunit of cAMP-dependent protein kinases [Flaviramulus basaltis]|uniref:cAMP-binding domain of CRP or a regulatory subunit of cAMP-dependent protein kinases n=1 Tax=Flaviramulus basaltis TaxID=369401 RepID=A0A1K2IH69_9FLAO|nr:Crp/Fnr family transcriptional regulator [Flaviramulus basaltis]SFZ91727.1 cAMP-binding domain of CRP or a regulatory subunit of cAMP-dependent protein kinases [Flaviramulus basaltis]